ncbi:MAG: zinc ribbon domain-containing protein [Lachnospiraceae bacterium]|nr:zinc ribbon domain-containing protein [Lachnospiraceae bacterium]
MKCPKCQNEIRNNAKFCTMCGCDLAAAMANPINKQVQPIQSATCVKCGGALMPGAKFCTKCGTPATPVESNKPDTKTVFIHDQNRNIGNPPISNVDVPIHPDPAPPRFDIVPPEPDSKKKGRQKAEQKQPKQASEKEGSVVGLVIAAAALGVLVIASAVVCFLIWNGTISLPSMSRDTELVSEESTEETTESVTEEEEEIEINVDELFAEADTLLTTGKSQISVDAEIVNGMNNLSAAIDQFVAKAEEVGDASLAADGVTEAYTSYVTAVIRHKDMLNSSTLSGAIYAQVMMEINDVVDLGDELIAKGYSIDTASLIAVRDEFDTTYTSKIINTFNEFTSRATWSRTESWNLMSATADNMFDPSDLDNPVRLRYAYALAWWTQKQIETEMNSGTITAKGAAIKIANLIDVMDYNPMMIHYYITYMEEFGEDCTEVASAYNDIVEHLAQTQGIRIGEDIPLDHFWYFNDFGTYSVDSTNGVTPENRQWIRDRMSSVVFTKQ